MNLAAFAVIVAVERDDDAGDGDDICAIAGLGRARSRGWPGR